MCLVAQDRRRLDVEAQPDAASIGERDLFSLQKILGHTSLDMVRRYVNLDTDEVKRQHAQASPVDRLAIGPKVTVLLPWGGVADRLEELAWREQTSVEDLVRRGAEELVERSRDSAGQRPARAAA